ncbi:MAG: type IV pilus biogenesis/stability protein PilW [Polaromonas sp.]|nr:type IV pilus biogenesis/stability protein PilW [Polaromonas sp.]
MTLKLGALVMFSLVAAGWLQGCVSSSPIGAAQPNRADLLTESDEPPERRRARLRLELASGYFERGQSSVALDEIKQSLVADPGFVDAYNMRGLVYMRLNNSILAEESFQKALSLSARDPDVAHNYGYLLCSQGRYDSAFQMFTRAFADPGYKGKAKTLMIQGLCQARAGKPKEAEASLTQSFEIDAGNPATTYNLANLLYARNELARAQFYIRRLNNSDMANAESLWLGIKTERKMNNADAVRQLGDQLKKRFSDSSQAALFAKEAFSE